MRIWFMKQYHLIVFLLSLSISLTAQKSKVLAVKQMIDAGKYEEAKEAIEDAIGNSKTSGWHRTYYMKGLLCQTAYEAGIEKKETKKINLYPDQLYVAFDSYEKALELDARERVHELISNHFYSLANDFRSMGKELFDRGDYEESLRAFEHAILIGESELLSTRTDTSLVYNAAMAAYEDGNWEKAVKYLTGLHEDAHSEKTSILLATALKNNGDSIRSIEILREGAELYDFEESVVIYLVNELTFSGQLDAALEVLNDAIKVHPDDFIFHWARGLVYRRLNNYNMAISSFLAAAELAPDMPTLYYHIGLSYYNIGIDLRESALNITEIEKYQQVRQQYREKFAEAVKWLERARELDPENENIETSLHQLYYQLDLKKD